MSRPRPSSRAEALVLDLADVGLADLALVGGKNSSLGEMIGALSEAGVRVPGGYATTATAFRLALAQDGLGERIARRLEGLDVEDVAALAACGAEVRAWIRAAPPPAELEQAVRDAHAALEAREGALVPVAVRSSATAEDLPDASFAGQQETYLNVVGVEAVLERLRDVHASLYTDRAISYRAHHGFRHEDVSLSVGVQRMVRSDIGASGVLFTLDTESGFDGVVFVTSSHGLGECVVQGAVNPDEHHVHKALLAEGRPAIVRRRLGSKERKMVWAEPGSAERVRVVETSAAERGAFALSDAQVLELARCAVAIERHYGRAMDVEWGLDGRDGSLWILQARPETVASRRPARRVRHKLQARSEALASGRAIGTKVGVGVVRVVGDPSEMHRVQKGDVLVADMTDPNWEPVMKRAAAIVTARGGRTCHAAIIARELGIPAVVGCGDALERLQDGQVVTVSCCEGETGVVWRGALPLEEVVEVDEPLPEAPCKLMLNVGNPELAFGFATQPNEGVGLARIEFVVGNAIGVHPRAVLEPERLPDEVRARVAELAAGHASPARWWEDKLAEGVATIAAAFWPKPVIVRLSDFKSNEYRALVGGEVFEPVEENPMIGFRGASRYVADEFAEAFAMECRALKRVREELGLTNVELMVPFVRTLSEAQRAVALLARHGLARGGGARPDGSGGLRLVMMCEVPSNALLADRFLDHFDGFSIGSNDLTQLCLGLDRDSGLVASSFDERDPAVRALIAMAVEACRRRGRYIGICGQGPSDFPDFAEWLVDLGIGSISLNPDTVVDTWRRLARRGAQAA